MQSHGPQTRFATNLRLDFLNPHDRSCTAASGKDPFRGAARQKPNQIDRRAAQRNNSRANFALFETKKASIKINLCPL
jgi:hypothetical protein